MKKILSLIMVTSLFLAGCCSLTAPDGTVTKSTANCFKTAQDKVCNAPPEVITIAQAVLSLLTPELATLVPGTAPFIAYMTAQNIQATGCAVLTDLNTMIAFIQGMNTKTKMMAAKVTKGIVPPMGINVSPLIDWRNGSGK